MASLTSAQYATLKAAILADNTLSPFTSGPTTDYGALANALNTAYTPAFYVWRSTVPASEIANSIIWAKLTPQDVPDGTQAWLNRAMACQGFQFNIQNIFYASAGSVATGLPNIRQGLNDSLSAVPSGASGAVQSAGWNAVKTTITRQVTRAEKVFATGTGTQGIPGDLGWEGTIAISDINQMFS